LPARSSADGGGGTVTFRLFDSATLSCNTFPACIKRRRAEAAEPSRWERICRFKESAVVLLGLAIVMTRSGCDVEKRTTMSRGVSAAPADIAVTLRAAAALGRVVGKLRSLLPRIACVSLR
jgi:hypothetical protein